MQVKVVKVEDVHVHLCSVCNGRWPRSEDVSVKVRADRAVVDAWARAAVRRCMVIGSAPKLREVIFRQTFGGSPVEKR